MCLYNIVTSCSLVRDFTPSWFYWFTSWKRRCVLHFSCHWSVCLLLHFLGLNTIGWALVCIVTWFASLLLLHSNQYLNMQIWPVGLQACISLLSFCRKDWCSQYYVPPRCHELCPTGVCHPLYTWNQRAHAGGDIKRAGQEVSIFYNNLRGKEVGFVFLIFLICMSLALPGRILRWNSFGKRSLRRAWWAAAAHLPRLLRMVVSINRTQLYTSLDGSQDQGP